MNSYEVKKFIKIILLLLAIFIGGLTLYFSQQLAQKVAQEEKKKIATWAKAVKISGDPEVDEANLTFYLELIQDNTTIPAIVVDEKGRITQQFINLDKNQLEKSGYLEKKRQEFAEENEPIPIPIAEGIVYRVYYGESSVLKQLRYYPYVFAHFITRIFRHFTHFYHIYPAH